MLRASDETTPMPTIKTMTAIGSYSISVRRGDTMNGAATVAARSEANRIPRSRVAQRLVRAAAVIIYLLAFTAVPATAQYYDPYGRYQGSRSFFGYRRPSGGPGTVDFPAHQSPARS